MQAVATLKPTDPHSVSTNFPEGCQMFQRGLALRNGLEYDEWMEVGTRLSQVTGAVMWAVGDWLAYGEHNYLKSKWGNRVPDGLYKEIAARTGYAEQTLTNAKYVCSALEFSRRRENLTFGHAAEIVGRADKEHYEFWMGRVEKDKLSVKSLREQLRLASATYRPEANDTGDKSFLETMTQFARDYQAECSKFTPAYRAEAKKILAPVLRDLA